MGHSTSYKCASLVECATKRSSRCRVYCRVTCLQSRLDQIERVADYDAGSSADVAGPEVCRHLLNGIACYV